MALVENTIRARIVGVTQREMALPEDAARGVHHDQLHDEAVRRWLGR